MSKAITPYSHLPSTTVHHATTTISYDERCLFSARFRQHGSLNLILAKLFHAFMRATDDFPPHSHSNLAGYEITVS